MNLIKSRKRTICTKVLSLIISFTSCLLTPNVLKADNMSLTDANVNITDAKLKLAVVRELVMQKLIRVQYQDPVAEPTPDLVDEEIAQNTTISKELAKRVRGLKLNNAEISNLQGLEEFSNLAALNLSNNKITNVSYLANLTDLTHLNLGHNQINSIADLKELKYLTEFYLNHNQLSDISVLADFKELTELDISHNKIFDLSPLKGVMGTLVDLSTHGMQLDYKPTTASFDLPFRLKDNEQVQLTATNGEAEKVKINGHKLEILQMNSTKKLELTFTSSLYGRKLYKLDANRSYQGKLTLDLSSIKTEKKYLADEKMPYGTSRTETDALGNTLVYKGTKPDILEEVIKKTTLPPKEGHKIVAGSDGLLHKITTYTVDQQTGEVTAVTKDEIIKAAIPDKYELIKQNDHDNTGSQSGSNQKTGENGSGSGSGAMSDAGTKENGDGTGDSKRDNKPNLSDSNNLSDHNEGSIVDRSAQNKTSEQKTIKQVNNNKLNALVAKTGELATNSLSLVASFLCLALNLRKSKQIE